MSTIPTADADYVKQVLDRFAKRQGSFVTQFTVLSIFAVSFIAFILAPIVALKLDGNRLANELVASERVVQKLQAQADLLQAKRDELTGMLDSVNGELTSLFKVQDDARIQAEETERQIADKTSEIAEIAANNEKLEQSLAGLTDAASRMTAALGDFDPAMRTDVLRDWFRQIANSGSRDPDCADDERHGYLGCMVRSKLHRDWDADFARIDAAVVSPLRAIEPSAAEAIATRIQKVRDTFETALDEQPNFWRTVNEKEEFMELLRGQFEVAFSDIAKVIQTRSKGISETAKAQEKTIDANTAEANRLSEALAAIKARQEVIAADQKTAEAKLAAFTVRQTELETQSGQLDQQLKALLEQVEKGRAALTENQARIEAEQKKIAERLTKFQSPFGSLPLGLNEATLAFPFILAVGFLICALLQADLLSLRAEYHAMMQPFGGPAKQSSEDRARTTRRVLLLAPLWLDPVRSAWTNLAGTAVLLLPVLAFAVTVWLILGGVLQLSDPGSSERYLRMFYFGLYPIGIALVIIGIGRVAAKWVAYRRKVGL